MVPYPFSLYVAQAAALTVLLLCGLLVYRVFPRRYILVWNAGWLLYLGHVSVACLAPARSTSLLSLLPLLGGQLLIVGAIGEACDRRSPFRVALPAVLLAALAELLVPAVSAGAQGWPTAFVLLVTGLMATWWVVRHYSSRRGTGAALLAFALVLRLVHPPHPSDPPLMAFVLYLGSAAGAVLAMAAMLMLRLEATRLHLRWGAAPGVVSSVAADQASADLFGPDAVARIASAIQRVFDADFAGLHLLQNGETPREPEINFLLGCLPRSSSGPLWCSTVIEAGRGPEAARWLEQHGVRWAVVVPIPRNTGGTPAGLFVTGYRHRHWVSPQSMQAQVAAGRQLGIVLENTRLLQQLSHSHREWVNAVDAIGDLILVHDADYRIQRTNRALAERLGGAPVDLIHRSCREVFPALAQQAWTQCPFCELPPGGDTYFEELHGYFLVSTSHYPREEPTGILHVGKDITDRKRAEEKYRTIFEKVREGVFISAVDGRFIDFNEATARMLGYEREELLSLDIRDLYVNPEERDQLVHDIRELGYISDYELRLRRKNGEVMIALETSFGTRDESGQVRQFQGFLLDITARKKAEEQLHKHVDMLSAVNALSARLGGSLEVEQLLRAVSEALPGIFGFDTVAAYALGPGQTVAVSVARTGYRSEMGRAIEKLQLPPEIVEAIETSPRRVLRRTELPEMEGLQGLREQEGLVSSYLMLAKGKQARCGFSMGFRRKKTLTPAEENLLEAVARQLEAAVGNAELYQQTRRAYDELRVAQEQLLQSEKMAAIGQLVSGVAHELNNPLTAIIGYSQLLGTHVAGKGTEYVEKLLHQARRTQRIIQNLLSFARQHKPERHVADLNRVIDDALLLREYDLRTGNVNIVRQPEENLPPVFADTHQLEQVFLNIINNAYDAIHDQQGQQSGTLEVRTFSDGDSVVAQFSDDGPGMAEPARVFDPFYTTKSVGKGTGLGLSICYGIVKEHGGEITAANRESGGAVFSVRLPIAQQGSAVVGSA